MSAPDVRRFTLERLPLKGSVVISVIRRATGAMIVGLVALSLPTGVTGSRAVPVGEAGVVRDRGARGQQADRGVDPAHPGCAERDRGHPDARRTNGELVAAIQESEGITVRNTARSARRPRAILGLMARSPRSTAKGSRRPDRAGSSTPHWPGALSRRSGCRVGRARLGDRRAERPRCPGPGAGQIADRDLPSPCRQAGGRR